MRGSRAFARLYPATYILSQKVHTNGHADLGVDSESGDQLDASELPVAESSASPERKRRPSWKGMFNSVRACQTIVSAVRQKKPTIKCMVFSYHGYSSLMMFEARPLVCVNKVPDRGASVRAPLSPVIALIRYGNHSL